MDLLNKKRKLEDKIKRNDRQMRIEQARMTEKQRKERAHRLIKLGALFEIAKLDHLEASVLLGYLLNYPKDRSDLIDLFFKTGSEELEKRKEKKKKRGNYHQDEKTFTITDILALFQLAQEKKIDIVWEMQQKFKKKLIEDLTYSQFEYLRNYVILYKN